MKNLYTLLITLFVFTFSNAQIVDIPDANFKNALVNTNCVDTTGNGVGDSDADLNDDGEIQVTEAEDVIWLDVSENNIVSLEGIQSFINLFNLRCYQNQLTSIDISQNGYLENINCVYNSLSTLNVSQNPLLVTIWAYENNIKSIDVTQNPLLDILWLYGNHLTEINLTQNFNLKDVALSYNQLSNLDISQNLSLEALQVSDNLLTSLNVSQQLNLYSLQFSNNQLTEINLTNNPNLHSLYCSNNQLTNLDLSQNPNLEKLFGYANELTELNLKNGTNSDIDKMFVYENPNLTCIEVDDVDYANSLDCDNDNWCKDDWAAYSEECILGLEDNPQVKFTIYPNPTQEVLFIESQQHIETVKVYNLQGQLIKEDSKSRIDVSNLSVGLYFVQVSLDGKTITKKFIKE